MLTINVFLPGYEVCRRRFVRPVAGAIATFDGCMQQQRNVISAVDSSTDLFTEASAEEDEIEREAREYR
jgi:hypothetical protein